MTATWGRANNRHVPPPPPLSTTTLVGLLGSAVAGATFIGLGGYGFVATGLPGLFCFVLVLIGALGLALAALAQQRRRAPWAYLIAMWSVVAFCAFFTAPQVLALDKLKQVTVELELEHGRDKAAAMVSDDNLKIRVVNLGLCLAFTTPFVVLCVGLVRGRRDYEQAV